MPDNIKYTFNVDGKSHQVSEENIKKYGGWKGYAEDYPEATVRMNDHNGDDYDIPIGEVEGAIANGFRPFVASENNVSLSLQRQEDTSDNISPGYKLEGRVDNTVMDAARNRMARELDGSYGVANTDAVAEVVRPVANTAKVMADSSGHKPIEEINRAIEEGNVDIRTKRQGELPKNSESNILGNYRNRYLLTNEGKSLTDEIDKKQNEITGRLAKEYLGTEAYKKLASTYRGEELDKRANDEFSFLYGDIIEKEMQPMYEKMQVGMLTRYGDRIEGELTELNKGNAATQVETLAKDVDRMIDSRHEGLRSRHGGSNNAMNALMGSGQYNRNAEVASYRKDIGTLEAAKNLLQESQDIINEAREKGASGELLRGVRDAVFDVDTWTMGVSDMAHNHLLQEAAEKADKGEELTVDEQKLLEAAAVNMAVNAYYSSSLGRMYKAGKTTGYSVPFMLEFAINPVSGSGNAIAKGILKYGMRRFGISAAKGTFKSGMMRTGARLAGDALAAAAMTGTSGIARVASGAMERETGDVQFDISDNGKFSYAGRENLMPSAEAWAKSAASTYFENNSEMFFNAFSGSGQMIKNALVKVFPHINDVPTSYIGKLFSSIKNNPAYKNLAERTQFHGFVGEYAEEVLNNLANMSIGEMSWDEVTDMDQNIDTMLGLAPTSVLFSAFGIGGMARERYNNRREMRNAFGKMSDAQRQRVNELTRMQNEKGNEDLKMFIRMTIEDSSLTPEERRSEMDYVYGLAKERAMGSVQEEETEETVSRETENVVNASNRATGNYVEAGRRVWDNNSQDYVVVPGTIVGGDMMDDKEYVVWKPEDSEETVMIPKREIDPSSIQMMPTQEVVETTEEMIRDEAQMQAEREATFSPDIPEPAVGISFVNDEGQEVRITQPNPNGGWVGETAVLDEKGQPQVDKKGQPVMYTFPLTDDDYYTAMQAQIDARESEEESAQGTGDDTIMSGKKKVLDDGRIVSATSANEMETAFDVLDQAGNIIDSGVMPRKEYDALRDFENAPDVELGDDGLPVQTLDSIDMVENSVENERLSPVEKSKVSGNSVIPVRRLNSHEADEVIVAMQEHAEPAPELELTPENWTTEFGEDGMVDTPIGRVKMGENQLAKMFLKKRDSEFGMIKPTLTNPDLIIEEDSEATDGNTERNSSYLFVKTFIRNGEKIKFYESVTISKDGFEVVVSNHFMNPKALSKKMQGGNVIYEKEALSPNGSDVHLAENQNGLPDLLPTQGDNVSDNKGNEVSGEKQESSINNTGNEEKIQEQELEEANIRPTEIPTDEKGNPLYHRAPVEATLADLNDGSLTDDEIDDFISVNKEEADKLLKRISEKPPKIGTNKTKYLADKQAWQAKVADAKAQVDYWNKVEEQLKLIRQQPGDSTVEEIRAMGDPINGEELAAMMLGTGKLPLLFSEYKRETGFGNTDAKNMFGLFASKEKGGMTIAQAGEKLMLADLEYGTNFFDQDDPNAGRNAIIDVLSSVRTRGGLIDYIKNNREAMAERERQAEVEADELAKEQWFQDNLHMTPEEYELWNSGELFSESNTLSDEEKTEFYNTFVDEILNEENYDSRGERPNDERSRTGEGNEQRRVSGLRTESSEILQGEEPVPSNRTEGYQREPGEVEGQTDESLHSANDGLQGVSSGRELISPSRNQESVPDTYVPSRMEGESVLDYASRVNDARLLHSEEQKVDTNPTEAQKEAGNYRKGHIKIDGFDITIENPKGSERSGVDAHGKRWSVTMNNTYGYIRGTEGVDGDHIDVFLGNTGNGVYVVDQVNEDGSFDEHKVMYGFASMDEAKEAYLSNYSPGWKGLGNITGVSKETFKEWIDSSHRKTKPFAEYKVVQERAEGKRDGFVREEDGSNVRFREGKAESEEQSIIDRAKADGTYMKAPNGMPSRLTEKQWVQVRTKAFKKWFGDWEKTARIEKLKKNNPVEITGEEYKGQYELNRESAQKYILNNLRGEYTINDTGEIVKISKKGAKKVTSHSQGSEAHKQSIVAIPEMIGNSIFIEERPAYKDNAQYDSYRYYVTGLKIGSEDYTARITIGVKNGEFYYDHYLTDIEKGNLIEAAQSFKPTEDAPNPSYAGNKDNVLFSLLQTNSSKVIDENGEPLIVYHGTPNSFFYTFQREYIGSLTDKGVFGRGFYFTPDSKYANSFANSQGRKGKIMETYLGIKHPFIISDAESLKQFNSYYMKYATDDIFEEVEGVEERLAQAYEKGTQYLVSAGYDGVIARFNRVNEYIAFFPNQIKSAMDNNGEFSYSNDDIRFREVKDKDGSKSLVGLHNISGDKLRKALKLGGFANPSAAVIDIDKQSHEGYGEISLVLPSSMVAKNTGRNAGTFSGDAWTPTYPQIERQFNDEGSKRVYDDISKLPKEMQSDVRSAWNGYMEGRDADALAYQFLYEMGEAPELRKIEPVFSEDIRKKITEVDAIDDYDERNAAILKAYIDEKFDGDKDKFEEYIETRKQILQKKIDEHPSQKGFVYRRAVENLKDIEENGYEYNSVKGFYDEVMSDIRKSGGIDTYQTVRDVQEKISQSAELSKEYDEWKENLTDKYGIKEVLFKGYTPSGNRVYLPHTLENVSRMMRQQGLAGATGWGGSFSKFAAGLMKPVGTLNGIRQQKEKLTTNHEDVEAFREKWEKVYFDLGLKLNPDASAFDDTGLYRVEEIATQPNPKSFAKREYGVELSDEDVRQLDDMVTAIRNEHPAMYFETKFERPVYLNEFAAAVVPDNAGEDIVDAMNGAGIKVFTYKAGDETSREEAVKKASEIKGVRFRDMKTYHGSGARFERFDTSHFGEGEGESMLGKGVYTSKSRKIAENYAEAAKNKDEKGNGYLYEVRIPADNGGNYLDYDKVYDAKEMSEIAGRLHDVGVDVDFGRYFHGGKANGMNLYMAMAWNMPEGMDVNRVLSDAGYVGYKYSTRHDLGGEKQLFPKKSYVVFDEGNATITEHEQVVSEMDKISDALHTPVKIVHSLDELPEGPARKAIEKGRNVKGWYDTHTGEVVVYLPNATSVDDAMKTVLHEVVGHRGLRQLFGEQEYDGMMMKLYGQLPENVRKKVADSAVRIYKGDVAVAMDEYLAEQAEKNEMPSWWKRVVSALRDLLRKMGIDVSLSDNDVRYLLWRSRKALEDGDIIGRAEDVVMRNRLRIGEDEQSREEADYTRTVEAVGEFRRKYAGVGEVIVIRSRDSIRGQLEEIGISDVDISKLEDIVDENAAFAVYHPGKDVIVVLNTSVFEKDLNDYLWHENTHKALRDVFGENKEELINVAYDYLLPSHKSQFAQISGMYSGENEDMKKEECIVYFFEYFYVKYGTNSLEQIIDKAPDEVKRLFKPIFNEIVYGKRKRSMDGHGGIRGISEEESSGLVRNSENAVKSAETGRGAEEESDGYLRFREGAIGENAGEQGRPTLLDAYKKRILEQNSRIASLERKLDIYTSAEELSGEVVEEIKRQIGSDIINEIGRRELHSLLLQVKNAKTKKSLEKIFMNVKKIALAAQSRKLQRVMDKLLALKVQDVNGKNMSIAKNVDDSTRRIFSFIRGKLSDIKKSGLEDDILYLKRDNRKYQEEIKRLERVIQEAADATAKDEAMIAIEEHKKAIEENKERIQELRDEQNEIERQVVGAGDLDVEKEIAALDEKMDKAAQGKVVWTQGDTERMAALNIISGQIMNKSHDFEIQSIELDIQQMLLNNSNLYRDRMKEVSENKRRQITNQINENRRQIIALERLINDTRAMQLKQQQMTIEQLEELINNGKSSLLRRTEEELKRKSYIIGHAIRTVEGKPIDIYDKKSDKEGALKKFFSGPLGSFEYMCKRVNTKTFGKDGFLYKYFVEGEDGVMKAYDTYVLGMEDFRKRLNDKSKEIFGKEFDAISSISDKVEQKTGVYVFDPNKGEGFGVKYEMPLSKGQAMYIYQVWKMNDGRTKLEKQGFNEESIAEIIDFIGDSYIRFADWTQEELLPDLREKYNEKYLEMYGTSLADIKDYVPLRIVNKSIRQESDLSEDKERKKTLEERAGSLINRVANTKPVDITMSAFDILFDHGRQMEEWNAYARVRRDLDAVLSNTTFRNQLDANTRGGFRNFYDAAAVATKVYHPEPLKYMDEILGKLSKGIVGGNIAWRLSTALKQVLSAPAFWGYSQSPLYMKSLLTNTAKMPVVFKWCMENIPSFRERVAQGTVGNEKLDEKGISKFLDKYIETGMIPNKLVDAVTCSVGAKSIFDYRYGQLIKQGLNEEKARSQALMDADIYYNQTQQSSHPAFLSPMQMSRSIMDRMATTYQNSNIGYVRKVLSSYYDLTRSFKWKELQKNYTDMYMEEGMSEDEASRKAYRRLLNENRKSAFEAILFGWGLNLLWNIGSRGLLGFFAGDDDDNNLAKGVSFFLTSPVKGMPGGNLLESIASGYGMNPVLVYDELDKFMREIKFAIDEYGLISPEIAFATMEKVSRYGGVDLEVLGNIYLGVEGLARDGALNDDKMIDFMYMLNSPKSNRVAVAKELYKDDPMVSFAEKVARANKYISKNDPWEGWVPGTKDLNKRRKNDIEKKYENIRMTEEERIIDDKYLKYQKECKETGKLLHEYTDEVLHGNFDYLEKLTQLQKSKEYKRYSIFKNMNQEIEGLQKMKKDSEGLRRSINELKKKAAEKMDKID